MFEPDFDPFDALSQLGHNQEDLYNRIFKLHRLVLEMQQQINAQEHNTYKMLSMIDGLIKKIKDLNDKD